MVALWVQTGRLMAGLVLVPLGRAFSARWRGRCGAGSRLPIAIPYCRRRSRHRDSPRSLLSRGTSVPRSRVQHTTCRRACSALVRPGHAGHPYCGHGAFGVTVAGLDHMVAAASATTCCRGRRAMLSEHRLHPASILFALAGSLKAFALPALLLFFSSLRSSTSTGADPGWGRAGGSTAGFPGISSWTTGRCGCCSCLVLDHHRRHRPLPTFRIRYEGSELVIRPACCSATSGTCPTPASRTSMPPAP